jgi:xylulokinase
MSVRLFAGLDVSTQSCKLVVIDLDEEQVTFTVTVNYDQDLPRYGTQNGVIPGLGTGVSESEPGMWIEAIHLALQGLKETGIPLEHIRCLSVSGQQHGLVSLDTHGELARPRSKLWNDFSTQKECTLLTTAAGGLGNMIQEVGNSQRTGYTAAKIYHMVRHEPDNYARTETFLLVHNYINWILTGGVCVMEPGDASGTALWNPNTGEWSQHVINLIEPGLMEKFPPMLPSDLSIGTISQALVEEYGFSPACKIDAGSGDNMYGAVGTGNVRPGIVTISLGTSGTAYTFLENAFIDPHGEIAAFCDSTGNHLPLLCVSNLANGYDAFLAQYGVTHEEFSRLIQQTEPGNAGRLLIPWYTGERTPDIPQAVPVSFGFKLKDFTPEVLSRAILEGHVLNLFNGFQRMPVKPEEIRLTGGLSRSEAWGQAIADIFDAATVPVEGEGAALGAALHAAWVWLKEDGEGITLDDLVAPFVRLNDSFRKKPRPEYRENYRLQKALFHALSQRLQGKNSEDPFVCHSSLMKILRK